MSANLDIAWRVIPRVGETESGDAVVIRSDGTRKLVALIDALGHGTIAAKVAATAVLCIETGPLAVDAVGLMQSLHEVLRGSRGAAVTLFCIDGLTLEGCMVGNVDVRSFGSRVPSLPLSGVVGTRLPRLRAFRAELSSGARVFVHSDGISRRAPFEALARGSADEACSHIMENHRHDHDDSSIIAMYVDAPKTEHPPRTR